MPAAQPPLRPSHPPWWAAPSGRPAAPPGGAPPGPGAPPPPPPAPPPGGGSPWGGPRRTRFFLLMTLSYVFVMVAQVGALAHQNKLGSDRVSNSVGALAVSVTAGA